MVFTSQELDDPLILIYEKKISNLNAVVKILELALKASVSGIIEVCLLCFSCCFTDLFWVLRSKGLYWLLPKILKVKHLLHSFWTSFVLELRYHYFLIICCFCPLSFWLLLWSEHLTLFGYNSFNALKVCAIKAPGFGENRKANLQDLAILTGGDVGPFFSFHFALFT